MIFDDLFTNQEILQVLKIKLQTICDNCTTTCFIKGKLRIEWTQNQVQSDDCSLRKSELIESLG